MYCLSDGDFFRRQRQLQIAAVNVRAGDSFIRAFIQQHNAYLDTITESEGPELTKRNVPLCLTWTMILHHSWDNTVHPCVSQQRGSKAPLCRCFYTVCLSSCCLLPPAMCGVLCLCPVLAVPVSYHQFARALNYSILPSTPLTFFCTDTVHRHRSSLTPLVVINSRRKKHITKDKLSARTRRDAIEKSKGPVSPRTALCSLRFSSCRLHLGVRTSLQRFAVTHRHCVVISGFRRLT